MCGLNSACVAMMLCMCVCFGDGIGCMFTGLQCRAGLQPAETMGLENGVCLCVPLLSQQETQQLSPLSLHLFARLTHSPALLLHSSPFFLTLEYTPFILFYLSHNLFSPDVFPPHFLSVLFSLCSSLLLLLFVFSLFLHGFSINGSFLPSHRDRVCVSNRT